LHAATVSPHICVDIVNSGVFVRRHSGCCCRVQTVVLGLAQHGFIRLQPFVCVYYERVNSQVAFMFLGRVEQAKPPLFCLAETPTHGYSIARFNFVDRGICS
jgi:hypothetical protein